MYHPTRGGVRGGRDQFKWDDVKVDKHRENYLGHSVKASVGRWQKGKDLFWYARDKNSKVSDQDALKAEIQRVKEEEEQSMREALGLAPKRASRPQGNRLDKHEFSELVKRGSTTEDVGAGHAEAAKVDGLGFARAPRPWEASSSVEPSSQDPSAEPVKETTERVDREGSDEDGRQKKRKHDERKREKHEERKREKHDDWKRDERKRHKHEERHSRDSDDKRKHRKDKEKKRRHDSD